MFGVHMPEQFTGRVEVQTETDGLATIVLSGNTADVLAGGNGRVGGVSVRDDAGTDRVTIRPRAITIHDTAGTAVIEIDAQGGTVTVGATGSRGQIAVQDAQGVRTVLIGGGDAKIELGADGQAGDLRINDNAGVERIRLRGSNGVLTFVDPTSGDDVLRLDGGTADLHLGRVGQDGDVFITDSAGTNTIHLGGDDARIELGAAGEDGTIHVRNDQGQDTIRASGQQANLLLGGNGADGDIWLFRDDGDISDTATATVHVDGQNANLNLGGQGADGDIWLFPTDGDRTDTDTASIHLSGDAGDIILQNADVAEDFDVAEPGSIGPGTVVVIGEDARLRTSDRGYDRRVAGVVAGTGDPRPGIILGRHASGRSRVPVALIGRVQCQVDTTTTPIVIGDLLTTSTTPGHAMKADDPDRAHGAVIGKALQGHAGGTGTIPILVALQ
jgi:hypothetical protein